MPADHPWYIRRARPEDAPDIHEVHMRSIREVCSRDHTLAEIMAWGGRAYDEHARRTSIERDWVWVVQRKGGEPHEKTIAGFGCLARVQEAGDSEPRAHVRALYFAAEILGLGLGKEMLDLMIEEAHRAGFKRVTLESSLTAHGFYLRHGFRDSGPMSSVVINGERIRCFPMERLLEVMPVDL